MKIRRNVKLLKSLGEQLLQLLKTDYNISQEPSEIFKSLPKILIAAVKSMAFILRQSL